MTGRRRTRASMHPHGPAIRAVLLVCSAQLSVSGDSPFAEPSDGSPFTESAGDSPFADSSDGSPFAEPPASSPFGGGNMGPAGGPAISPPAAPPAGVPPRVSPMVRGGAGSGASVLRRGQPPLKVIQAQLRAQDINVGIAEVKRLAETHRFTWAPTATPTATPTPSVFAEAAQDMVQKQTTVAPTPSPTPLVHKNTFIGHGGHMLCGSVSRLGSTKWEAYGYKGLSVLVDTSECKFRQLLKKEHGVQYFASVIGDKHEWALTGTNCIYDEANGGFRVFAYHPTLRKQSLLDYAKKHFRVSWIGAQGVNTGATKRGQSGWTRISNSVMYVDVDTSRSGFTDTPMYVTALNMGVTHLRVVGAHSIYRASKLGFRVYIHYPYGVLEPAQAESYGWVINWMATSPYDNFGPDRWGGESGNADHWEAVKRGGKLASLYQVHAHLNSFLGTPAYVTSLQTDSDHVVEKQDIGAAAVFHPTKSGFTVYVEGAPLGFLKKFRVTYVGFERPISCAMTPWSSWSVCTRSCEGGWQHRTRHIVHRGNVFAAAKCGALSEKRGCGQAACPVDCEVSGWGAWSSCAHQKCGVGAVMTRERSVLRAPSSSPPGAPCPQVLQSRSCDQWACTGEGRSKPCGGIIPANELWNSRVGGSLHIAVDAKLCEFPRKPAFVVSIMMRTANQAKWQHAGEVSAAEATREGFIARIYHHKYNAFQLEQFARNYNWALSWVGDAGKSSGETSPGASGFQAGRDKSSVFIDVDTKGSSFKTTPRYISCLHGADRLVMGTHDLYKPSANGFRLYLSIPQHISIASIEKHRWTVVWIAVPEDNAMSGQSQNMWHDDALGNIYTDVETASDDFVYPKIPWYVTSIVVGDTASKPRATLIGSSAVVNPTAPGFRVYLGALGQNRVLTADTANARGWVVNYVAYLNHNCEVTTWTPWTPCTRTCLNGTQTRKRSIKSPAYGYGHKCPALTQRRSCNAHPCTQDCRVSHWSAWSFCSRTCGGGKRVRMRHVLQQPVYHGKKCPMLSDKGACATLACPIPRTTCFVTGNIDVERLSEQLYLAHHKPHMFIETIARVLDISPLDIRMKVTTRYHGRGNVSHAGTGLVASFQVAASSHESAKALQAKVDAPSFADEFARKMAFQGIHMSDRDIDIERVAVANSSIAKPVAQVEKKPGAEAKATGGGAGLRVFVLGAASVAVALLVGLRVRATSGEVAAGGEGKGVQLKAASEEERSIAQQIRGTTAGYGVQGDGKTAGGMDCDEDSV